MHIHFAPVNECGRAKEEGNKLVREKVYVRPQAHRPGRSNRSNCSSWISLMGECFCFIHAICTRPFRPGRENESRATITLNNIKIIITFRIITIQLNVNKSLLFSLSSHRRPVQFSSFVDAVQIIINLNITFPQQPENWNGTRAADERKANAKRENGPVCPFLADWARATAFGVMKI